MGAAAAHSRTAKATPVSATPRAAGPSLVVRAPRRPIALLITAPAVWPAIAVVDVQADARIIEIAVPAERIVSAIISVRVSTVAVGITAIGVANANAAIAVRSVEIVGASAESQCRPSKGKCKTQPHR